MLAPWNFCGRGLEKLSFTLPVGLRWLPFEDVSIVQWPEGLAERARKELDARFILTRRLFLADLSHLWLLMWKNHADGMWPTKFPEWWAHLSWTGSFEHQESRIPDFQWISLSVKGIRDCLDKYGDV
jgi:hypothetical protein